MSRFVDRTGIDRVLTKAVEQGALPHVVAIAADADGVFYEKGVGPRVAGASGGAVTTSSYFRMMSMTKIIVTVAALQQVERGMLDLDDPVARYLSEFADLEVLDGFDGDRPILRDAASAATVRQLITHTSGLGYWFWNEQLVAYEAATGIPNIGSGLAGAFASPLVADPGTQFTYGISTDWLGRVVEHVAGQGLDAVIRDGITEPLGMRETTFLLDDAQRADAVTVHVRGEDGAWISAGEMLNQSPDWWSGGHGLYSTPRDYIRFERALLRGGELDGSRILTRDTVDAIFTNQIGDIDFPAVIPTANTVIADTMHAGPGHKWGMGLLLNTEDIPGRRRAGSGGWAGLLNTHFLIDRGTGVCASIYTNSLPFLAREDAWKVYLDFEEALYAAL